MEKSFGNELGRSALECTRIISWQLWYERRKEGEKDERLIDKTSDGWVIY